MLWHILIEPAPSVSDSLGDRLAMQAVDSGLAGSWSVKTSRGFLIEGDISREQLDRAAKDLLVDPVVEVHRIEPASAPANGAGSVVHVLPKPGVTDPEGAERAALLCGLGYPVSNVRTIKTYRLEGPADSVPRFIERVLANDAVEMTVRGSLALDRLDQGQTYRFRRVLVPIREQNDAELMELSRSGQLALSLPEMKTIQSYFADLGREPTDCELETLAQTWSEHCSHKTLRGRISFRGRTIENLLKQTIFKRDARPGLRLAGERLCR